MAIQFRKNLRRQSATKRIYFFGGGKAEGRGDQKVLLGGKGANLHQMTRMHLPVPPGFTITTETCAVFFQRGESFPPGLVEEVLQYLRRLEKITGKKLGSPANPLLLAVRSGAAVSMPGMMDTILNLGLNDEVVEGLAKLTGNPRFAYDSYRRLISMYADVVMDVDFTLFENELAGIKRKRKIVRDTDLSAEDMKQIINRYKQIYQRQVGEPWPQDPLQQLKQAIAAVFKSWNNLRAVAYRRIHKVDELAGTAVTVQAMVFGNLGEDSGTGVAFTRNPSTGENKFYGEFLVNAQGEDVVSGLRTPIPCEQMPRYLPKSWKEVRRIKALLEKHYRDVQDFEFTIEKNKLYILQTRTARRSAAAAVKIAVDMVNEKLIDRKTAIGRLDPTVLQQLLHPTFDPQAQRKSLTTGLPASPGAAVGRIAFSAEEADRRVKQGEKIILVRQETVPADIVGMHVSEGILTSTGGMTSHAAVVARGMGKPCVAGAGELQIDPKKRLLCIKGKRFTDQDYLSIDGASGQVYAGQLPTVEPKLAGPLKTIAQWLMKYHPRQKSGNNQSARTIIAPCGGAGGYETLE